MAEDRLGLAGAFAEAEPEGAARALEEIPSEDAALFLAELAPKVAAAIVEHLSPGSAARRLSLLEASHAAAILVDVGSRGCGAILRACASDPRRAILAELPPRLVQQFRRSLTYTRDTVGAWIEYDVPSMSGNRTAGEALGLLRQRNRAGDHQLFVVRAGHIYAGLVPMTALLHSASDTPLSRIADRRIRPVSDTTDVDDIENSADWDDCAMLPVTAPDGSLLGGLSRAGMRRAVYAVFPQPLAPQPESLLAHLFAAYLNTGAEMLRLLIGGGRKATIGKSSNGR